MALQIADNFDTVVSELDLKSNTTEHLEVAVSGLEHTPIELPVIIMPDNPLPNDTKIDHTAKSPNIALQPGQSDAVNGDTVKPVNDQTCATLSIVENGSKSQQLDHEPEMKNFNRLSPIPITEANGKKSRYIRDTRIYDVPLNKPKFISVLARIEAAIEYKFNYPILVREAMWSHMAHKVRLPSGVILTEGHMPLAQVGDKILGYQVMMHFWNQVMPNGEKMKKGVQELRTSALVSDKNLDRVCDRLEITDIVLEGYPWGPQKGLAIKTRSSVVEALIAAVYIDSGEDVYVTRRVLKTLLGVELAEGERGPSVNDRVRKVITELRDEETIEPYLWEKIVALQLAKEKTVKDDQLAVQYGQLGCLDKTVQRVKAVLLWWM